MEAEESRARNYKRECSRRDRGEESSSQFCFQFAGSKFPRKGLREVGGCSTRRS